MGEICLVYLTKKRHYRSVTKIVRASVCFLLAVAERLLYKLYLKV